MTDQEDMMLGQRTDDLMAEHWLTFVDGQVTGCHCGYPADQDSDCGYGDSVVRHLFDVALQAKP